MVRLLYCPNCEKAYRFHARIKRHCPKCESSFETVEVRRTKFFILQFPFLIIGFIIIIISAFFVTINQERLMEPIGLFILGFALLLFALALQFLDSSKMEQLGSEIGIEKFSTKHDKERISAPSDRFKPTTNFIENKAKVANKSSNKFEQLKLDNLSDKEKQKTSDSILFTKPNQPGRVVKGPKRSEELKSVKLSKLSGIIKQKEEKKRPRKIRKAI